MESPLLIWHIYVRLLRETFTNGELVMFFYLLGYPAGILILLGRLSSFFTGD